MNILKTKTSWTNWELGLLKLCVGAFYLCIGIYFHEYLQPFIPLFGVIFLVLVIILMIAWIRKEKIRY